MPKSLTARKAALAFSAVLVASVAGCASTETPGPSAAKMGTELVAMRRITESQYRHAIADIFGADIKIAGRFEPEVRREGLLAVGSGQATVSPSGIEQYYAMAQGVAEGALDARHRDKTMPCKPVSEKAADDACARQVVSKVGRLLFRRNLTNAEIAERVTLARGVADQTQDFYAGVQEALISLLTAPEHMFRMEMAVKDRQAPGGRRLDGYAKASRLSYLFWDTAPDAELLAAAESGALDTPEGLQAQADRLAASPRAADGMTAFFDDMLQMSLFDTQTFDPKLFPKYSAVLARAARDQTLKTIVNLLITQNGDYRDIFTTRDTFINRQLAMVYSVPYNTKVEWQSYTFAPDSGREGILTQISFLSLFSHPGRSSPTKRGVALNEIFLCEVTPAPPNNVDFSIVNETSSTTLKTTRARLLAHATDETCAGCHNLVDPYGLALERFDALGQRRDRENGELIDVTSEYDGVKFEGSTGVAQLLRNNPRVPECLVRNILSAGRGRAVDDAHEHALVASLTQDFAAGGYRLPAFLKRLAVSDAFYDVPPPAKAAPPAKVAVANPLKLAALTRQSEPVQ